MTATSNNLALIPNPTVTYTSPNATGSLTFTPVAGQSGSATVTVTVQDNGGTANGGVNTVTRTFTVTVTALPVVTITATDANAAETNLDPGVFTVSRTGSTTSALTVSYTIGGMATNSTDYQNLTGTVTIAAGQASNTITITPIDDSVFEGPETAILTLAANAAYTIGAPSAATVTIADNDTLGTITLPTLPTDVGAGLQRGAFTGDLGAPAPTGGVTVRIQSSNAAVVLVSPNATTAGTAFIDIARTAGQQSFTYYVQGVEGQAGNAATLTASATNFTSGTGGVNVRQPGVDILDLSETPTTLSADDPFYVRLGWAEPGDTTVRNVQEIRAGGVPITANLSLINSNPAGVAQLTTLAGSAQTRTVTIAVGSATSPGTVADGGVAFDALLPGTVQVQATIPGFVTTGVGTRSITVTGPDLAISKAHTGNFTQGQTGATYTITVSNSGSAATSGTVTVTDTLPTGLTATAIAGTGWSCTLGTLTCTRSDALAVGGSYPALTLTVNVAANAPASVTNTATVSGNGDTNAANNTASDVTAITPVADLTITKTHTGSFTQGQTGATYTITVGNAGPGPTSGTVTVTDTLPTGLTATNISGGSGWNCTLGTLTCTRSDVLQPGTNYSQILLTVNVASNAPASVTNTCDRGGRRGSQHRKQHGHGSNNGDAGRHGRPGGDQDREHPDPLGGAERHLHRDRDE